ncbi:YHS domain-containing (seleno)protein [Chitinophaga japonensis]|uniref:YHS domain-containing protein n=1 Tax=Chitinophaga japonensis TaxID=104662 RepID=A0A562T2L3_CHIJA|nr:YHS domain-containing (seleno)protein [Chitinophaga japonensis]TWI87885.1 hypothetical protein LX66_1959 [Chitinophaga japonensis]
MRNFVIAATVLLLAACGTQTKKGEIFAPDGQAIKGYDPVAFFREGKPVAGSGDWTYTWKDAQWRFASKENLDSFKTNPEHYAPQYGGWCAYGTSQGHKAPTTTDTWTIVDGKLYFNYDQKVKATWMTDQPGYIEKADSVWVDLKDKE